MNLEKLRQAVNLHSSFMNKINDKIKACEKELRECHVLMGFKMMIDGTTYLAWDQINRLRWRIVLNVDNVKKPFLFATDTAKIKYHSYLDKFVDKFTQHIINEYETLTNSMNDFKELLDEDHE